jgi:hypothetical protein
VYYAYSDANDKEFELDYSRPVVVTCDFNATKKPMSWCVLQEQDDETRVRYALAKTHCNTQTMCEYLESVLVKDGSLPGELHFYGDYSGMHNTSNSAFTDWEIIEKYFFQSGKCRGVTVKKPCKSVRDSASVVNARLKSADGTRKLFLYPGVDTKALRTDFLQVVWKDAKIDDSEDALTHSSDSIRYYCMSMFPPYPRARRIN